MFNSELMNNYNFPWCSLVYLHYVGPWKVDLAYLLLSFWQVGGFEFETYVLYKWIDKENYEFFKATFNAHGELFF